MKQLITLMLLLSIVNNNSHAQNATQRKKHFNTNDGIAVQGYDVVGYFIQSKAIKGNKNFAVIYEGLMYYFTSVENKEAFKKNPAKYEPEYGGWCAYAMGSKGEKVEIDPKTFKVLNGKLYLFYNKYFNNTLTDWNKDENNLKKKADASWQKLIQ